MSIGSGADIWRQLEMPTGPVWVHASGDENLKGRQASQAKHREVGSKTAASGELPGGTVSS